MIIVILNSYYKSFRFLQLYYPMSTKFLGYLQSYFDTYCYVCRLSWSYYIMKCNIRSKPFSYCGVGSKTCNEIPIAQHFALQIETQKLHVFNKTYIHLYQIKCYMISFPAVRNSYRFILILHCAIHDGIWGTLQVNALLDGLVQNA